MAIVVCCTQKLFFSAASAWLEAHPEFKSDTVDFVASLEAFMTRSWFSTLFLAQTGIFSFQQSKFIEAFPQWKQECIENQPGQADLFDVLEGQVIAFMHDDRFLINAGLVVTGCLDNEIQEQTL